MPNIPISKEGGLEAHLCVCERCMKNDSGALTLGVLFKTKGSDGHTYYADRDKRSKTRREAQNAGVTLENWIHVDEHERVPMGLCDECKTEMDYHAAIVRKGGVYFKCTECHQDGVIQPNEFTYGMKKQHGIKEHEPIGIEFSKCTEHEN